MISLAIVYTPEGGRPLKLATVSDRDLLKLAATAAVREAEYQVAYLRSRDPVLGMVQADEVAKLKHVLGALMVQRDDPTVM